MECVREISESNKRQCNKCKRVGDVSFFFSMRYKKEMKQCEECRAQRREYKRRIDGFYERKAKKEEEAKRLKECLKGLTDSEDSKDELHWI